MIDHELDRMADDGCPHDAPPHEIYPGLPPKEAAPAGSHERLLPAPQCRLSAIDMLSNPRNLAPLVLAFLLLCVLALSLIPAHAEPPPSPDCFDELLVEWNQFARDANEHIQVYDVNRAHHAKVHDKLAKEFGALSGLTCW